MLVLFHLQMTVCNETLLSSLLNSMYVHNLYLHNINMALSVFYKMIKCSLNSQTLCLIKVIIGRTFAKKWPENV